eukprot:TRINITY_DN47877_c0_g1_i1.p1 TRINITY_DN47877_c0_g1~~TRINITY_DN47877_c0_g1_i1.p1  ORF type:complete len:144 (+),score=16.78 TRINITY_DN47877_c0_g1_i1:3-434(+)
MIDAEVGAKANYITPLSLDSFYDMRSLDDIEPAHDPITSVPSVPIPWEVESEGPLSVPLISRVKVQQHGQPPLQTAHVSPARDLTPKGNYGTAYDFQHAAARPTSVTVQQPEARFRRVPANSVDYHRRAEIARAQRRHKRSGY